MSEKQLKKKNEVAFRMMCCYIHGFLPAAGGECRAKASVVNAAAGKNNLHGVKKEVDTEALLL
ncbi:hypothetical protein [Geomonas azotofigens]|uniref:hypothetical protein n=1 Tax=Geomonas azotofigens TaxID=2843196 RepID=UPI001C123E7C|nr:hypothetical protein [Geomonas azotofigens]MBU5615162.1 hypothetical protein [Geomonas azotofigens]